jgi:superfamily I DNA/RNA helicase
MGMSMAYGAADDFRRTQPRFQGENFSKNLQLVEQVKAIANQKGATPEQLALAWLLTQGEDIVPIPGTKRQAYLEENVGAVTIELTPEKLAQIDQVAPKNVAAGERYSASLMETALHHLPNFWKMIALLRMAAMLREDGVFYLGDTVFSFPPCEFQTQIDAWIKWSAKPGGEGWTVADFTTHVRDEYTTFAWILERMIEDGGFRIDTIKHLTNVTAEYICKKSRSSKNTCRRTTV